MKKGFIILVSIAIMVFGSVSLFGQYGRDNMAEVMEWVMAEDTAEAMV